MLINPKEITIDFEGETLRFNIGKFPATVGREIITQYPINNIPKVGSYLQSEEIMLKLMKFVERVYDDRTIELSSKTLIDNHVPSWEVLIKIEAFVIDYNCSFFELGKVLSSLKEWKALAEPKNIKILMDSLVSLSQAEKQPSMN